MFLVLLIIGIVLIPKGNSLKCNECNTRLNTCDVGEEKQCSTDFVHCGTLRKLTYEGNRKEADELLGSCFKTDGCKDGTLDTGIKKYYFTSMCCDTDLCNTQQPSLPNLKPSPNGKKCYRCDGKSDCTGTLNCNGEETFCASVRDSKGNITMKGCATRSFCVNPPTILLSDIKGIECCEGNYCNGGGSTSACLLLLATMLTSLYFLSN